VNSLFVSSCRFPGWADRRNRGGLEGIRDAFLERRLRSDHREFDPVPLPPGDDALDVGHVPKEDVLRAPTDAGILVRHGGVDVRLASMERFDDRMLAASAPDHQDLHDPMRRKRPSGFLVSRTRVEHLDHFGGCMSLRKFPSESSNVTTLPHG